MMARSIIPPSPARRWGPLPASGDHPWQPSFSLRKKDLRASTVRRIAIWKDAAGIGNGSPLFRSMNRWGKVKEAAMRPAAVADVIRQRAAEAGINRAKWPFLRVGAAVSMASRGQAS